MLSAQEVLNTVVNGLRKQKVRSADNSGICYYRGPNGTMCAAGMLIPDEEYKPVMERKTIGALIHQKKESSLFSPETLATLEANESLIRDLQKIHDNFQPTFWEEKWLDLANKRGLTLPEKT